MRYVFFAFAGLGIAFAWLNHTDDGARAKRHLFPVAAQTAE